MHNDFLIMSPPWFCCVIQHMVLLLDMCAQSSIMFPKIFRKILFVPLYNWHSDFRKHEYLQMLFDECYRISGNSWKRFLGLDRQKVQRHQTPLEQRLISSYNIFNFPFKCSFIAGVLEAFLGQSADLFLFLSCTHAHFNQYHRS